MTEKEFLESSLLEEYALGLLIETKDIEVTEGFILNSSEVQKEFLALQNNMEKLAQSRSVKVPSYVKDAIVSRIARLDKSESKVIDHPASASAPKSMFVLKIAASVLILISSSLAYYNWDGINQFKNQNESLTNQLQELQKENDLSKKEFIEIQERFAIIADPGTKKMQLKGNERADDLNIIAYHNTENANSYLHVVNIPKAPAGKCFQLWGDVEGEMISLGVLTQKNLDFVEINHLALATSLNITMEKAGGSDHATVTALVASVII